MVVTRLINLTAPVQVCTSCTIYEYLVCKITHITVMAAQAGETDNYP